MTFVPRPHVPPTLMPLRTTLGGAAPQPVYRNRCYDTAQAGFVSWLTTGAPDTTGASYPGPDPTAVQTSLVVTRVS